MKNSREIIAEIKANAAEAVRLENEVRETKYSEKTSSEIVKKAEQAEKLRLVNKILRDNARRAFVNEVLPVILAVIEKYAGKAYGPKTKETIREELKERIGCAVWFNAGAYGWDEINITPLNNNGHTDYTWGYRDFELETICNGPRLFDGNKLQKIDADAVRLTFCAEWCDDAEARAVGIMEARRAVLEAYSKLSEEIKVFNSLVPSAVEHLSEYTFSGCVDL